MTYGDIMPALGGLRGGFWGRKWAVRDWILLHRPGTVVEGRTGPSPPACDLEAAFSDKRRVVHGDAFRLSNRRQECRRSQGVRMGGNPGRRSPVGALALGYDVAALQAGGAARFGMEGAPLECPDPVG